MEGTQAVNKPRPVGAVLIIAILLIPLIFAWFLLAKGYSWLARALGFGWLAFWFSGSLLFGSEDETKPRSSAPQPVASALEGSPSPIATNPKSLYMRKMDGLIAQLSKPSALSLPGTDPRSEINEAVATIGEWAKLYHDGRAFDWNEKERARRAELWRLIQKAQSKAFPRARALQGELWRQAAWEHEVDVIASGDRLLFRGPLFFLRANMKKFVETFEPTIVFLRFKRVSFQAYQGGDTSYFDYETPSDAQIATLGIGTWQVIKP